MSAFGDNVSKCLLLTQSGYRPANSRTGKDCLTPRPPLTSGRAKLRRGQNRSPNCSDIPRKNNREFSNLYVRWTGRLTTGWVESASDIRHVSMVELGW